MPWAIRGNAVINEDTGKVKGHSKNPKAYLRALYANAGAEAQRPPRKKKKNQAIPAK
jgi:hypothetical protein